MDREEYFKGIIKGFTKIADTVDEHKRGYDLNLLDVTALERFLLETGDTSELIRICYNVGFYRGIGYQMDFLKKQREEREEQEKIERMNRERIERERREQKAKQKEQEEMKRREQEINSVQDLINALIKATTEAEIRALIEEFTNLNTEPELTALTNALMKAKTEAERKGAIYAFMNIETEPESKPKRGRKKKAK